MTTPHSCRVCHEPLGEPLYRSATEVAITSLCDVRHQRAEVSFCAACGHLQTSTIADLQAYYDQDYRILIDSEEEDQLYAVIEGRPVYRTDHQVTTLVGKLALPPGARLLDYGCAKSSTFRRLAASRPDLDLYVFDVSEMYLPFWRRFLRPENWAIYQPKPEWAGSFDLVTSFFALEHVEDPRGLVADVARLLKPGGRFYCIVPNVYANIADFVVADHVHHFSATSLRRLLQGTGLTVSEIDGNAHAGAWILVACKERSPVESEVSVEEKKALAIQTQSLAEYWNGFARRVQEFEQSHAAGGQAAIYGSGFYGTFIATCLNDPDKIACFLDQNPHRQKQTLFGKPILPPEQLPENASLVYVGLNPQHARQSIANVRAWQESTHTYFFP